MTFEKSSDRAAPPEIAPIERDGVRYEQASDGRDVGVDQAGGVLVAFDAKSGKQLWTLKVYTIKKDPLQESDAQWVFFTSMKFDPDGRLRISNENGDTFLVDVGQRTSTPAR